jgi:Protein of unknown function (DUF3309)
MLSTILIVLLILLLIGALPNWPYSTGWGYGPVNKRSVKPERLTPLGINSLGVLRQRSRVSVIGQNNSPRTPNSSALPMEPSVRFNVTRPTELCARDFAQRALKLRRDAVVEAPSRDFRSGIGEAQDSAVSWAAVLAGGITSAALSLVLLAFGAGIGLSTVSPWSNSGVSSTTFKVGTGIYLVLAAIMASSIGGYIAGRLRVKWVGIHTYEVYFRDTAHGFLAWAFATLLSAAVLGSAASNIVSGASAALVVQATGSAAGQSAGPVAEFVDSLLRAGPAANTGTSDSAAVRSELDRLFVSNLSKRGDFSPADRTYMAQVVAEHTGMNQADAEKRVSQVITQAKSAVADARKAAAQFALWLTASLLFGAFSASLAATEGGGVRDGTWKY